MTGRSVSGGGDINGDGIDDLLIGAPGADYSGTYGSGQSFVVYGFNSVEGTSGNNRLVGTTGNNSINGLDGNDTIASGNGYDLLTGGGDRDRFVVRSGEATDFITDFDGVGRGVNPSQAVINEVDTLQFIGEG